MVTSAAESQQIGSYNIANTNIPSLAIRAASELDDLIEKRAQSSPTSRVLGDLLLSEIQGTNQNGQRSASLRSGTVALFCHALEQLPSQQPINKMSDLVTLATDISRELSDSKPQSELMRLKQFCIALAKASSTYRPSVDSYDPQLARR